MFLLFCQPPHPYPLSQWVHSIMQVPVIRFSEIVSFRAAGSHLSLPILGVFTSIDVVCGLSVFVVGRENYSPGPQILGEPVHRETRIKAN